MNCREAEVDAGRHSANFVCEREKFTHKAHVSSKRRFLCSLCSTYNRGFVLHCTFCSVAALSHCRDQGLARGDAVSVWDAKTMGLSVFTQTEPLDVYVVVGSCRGSAVALLLCLPTSSILHR